MPKFRKKPVVIEAMEFKGDEKSLSDILKWSNQNWYWVFTDNRLIELTIPTPEGNHLAEPGDFIIKGIAGEYYPCKPDIFEATYEPV